MSLRNRIAFYFMAVTALFTSILFLVIYYVVDNTVYEHLDADLNAELAEVSNSIVFIDNEMIFANEFEWGEREHGQIEVNPTFIQVIDTAGNSIRKTINLRDDDLPFNNNREKTYFDLQFSGSFVRQVQSPLVFDDQIKGYLIIAIPLEESALVLENLKSVLIISFPLVLILLFSVSRKIAGRIISPVKNIITTADLITRENLNERITLPPRKDELYKLADTINNLLNRLQDAVLREKQFTADASHELRTPLSVIRGTLEVLIRKERTPEQYEEKVKYVVSEIDRMTHLVEQLLSLARFESGKTKAVLHEINLKVFLEKIISRYIPQIEEKKLLLENSLNDSHRIVADVSMMETIFDNLVSNAVKYCNQKGTIKITLENENGRMMFSIKNTGETIPTEKLDMIFDRFYRVDQNRNSEIRGNGLGLAIVKRLIDLQDFSLVAESKPEEGTTFKIFFK